MPIRVTLALVVTAAACGFSGGCVGDASGNGSGNRQFPLNTLKISSLSIVPPAGDSARGGQKRDFRIWLALTDQEHQEGLMFVTADQIADDQGMLFVFEDERLRGFWMKNTVTPLDIAFARADGKIVAIHTMPALTLQTFSSIEPAMFALEVKAGTFEKLGVREGDTLVIPDEALP